MKQRILFGLVIALFTAACGPTVKSAYDAAVRG